MSDRIDVLILPGDEPIRSTTLKKHFLFFDSLTLANPADSALINDGDVVEKFPNMLVSWAPRNQFPRTHNYLDEFRLLLEETQNFQNRGLIRLTSKKPSPNLDPGMDHVLWHRAVGDRSLVESAIPESNLYEKPPLEIQGYIYNLVMAPQGYKSKYEIDTSIPAYQIENLDEAWSYFAHLRLGRFLKFLRKANAQGLIPISADEANTSLLNSISARTNSLTPEVIEYAQEQLISLAFSLEIFDNVALNKTLAEMSWKEVEKLRKITLPGISTLRQHIIDSAKRIRTSNPSNIETYSCLVRELSLDYQRKKERVAEEWEKLRIAAVLKVGGVVGVSGAAEITGLAVTAITSPWAAVLMKVLCGSLVAAASLSSELTNLLPARNAVKQHPLYFTERINK